MNSFRLRGRLGYFKGFALSNLGGVMPAISGDGEAFVSGGMVVAGLTSALATLGGGVA